MLRACARLWILLGIANLWTPQSQAGLTPLRLALKYVVYRDAQGEPAATAEEVAANMEAINQVWAACAIRFELTQYLAVRPADFRLRRVTGSFSDFDEIRKTFAESSELLVVTTGTWDRSGPLGKSTANAWTSMPGDGPYGAILERPVGKFANIIAHELGHYLNLRHSSEDHGIMNQIIYPSSTRLTSMQCKKARATAAMFWSKMFR